MNSEAKEMKKISCPKCGSEDVRIGHTARRVGIDGSIMKPDEPQNKCRICSYEWTPVASMQNTLTVTINAPVEEVFAFTVNPENTPKWIAHIVEEQASPWPPTVGTIYRNRTENSDWSEYTLVAIEENKLFELASNNSPYHVRYTYTSLDDGKKTSLEYFEWVTDGELEEPFTQDIMEVLKECIER